MKLSVVIPTRDRAEVLGRTLASLAAQQEPEGGFEVIVVDNGSGDGTDGVVESAARTSSLSLIALTEPKPGPAAARNRGVERASGEVVLFLGDDTEPADSAFLSGHSRWHDRNPDPLRALLGRVTWNPAEPITPFMRWLEDGGPQFGFTRLAAGPVSPSKHFYTANISLKRAVLEEAGGFDERFPAAALEDMELGLRLERKGLELVYDPELLVHHTHHTTLQASLRRIAGVAKAARLFNEIHPDAPLPTALTPETAAHRVARKLAPVLSRSRVPEALRRRAWTALHAAAYDESYRRAEAGSGSPLSRQYAKLCDLRDFREAALQARITELVPGVSGDALLHRKYWELATLTLFLEDVGALSESSRVLSVGAGSESVLFWLANRAGRVVATDIYGEGAFADREGDARMLTDPSAFAPFPYREDHLEVRHMDGRSLQFEDGSFDVVFSLSSIEHFGSPTDIAASAREMGRVLKPGGVAFITTECFVERRLVDSPLVHVALRHATFGRISPDASLRRRAVDVFAAGELEERIVRPSGLVPMQHLDLQLSPETMDNVTTFVRGRAETTTGADFPHIVLRAGLRIGPLTVRSGAWTSVALALRKPSAA